MFYKDFSLNQDQPYSANRLGNAALLIHPRRALHDTRSHDFSDGPQVTTNPIGRARRWERHQESAA